MSWFGQRRDRPEVPAGQVGPGEHTSPGLALFTELLDKRPSGVLLDLGASSTENLEFLARHAAEVAVGDVFRTRSSRGHRGEIFHFEDAEAVSLPEKPDRFAGLLLWDLLHYFTPKERRRFADLLSERLAPGAPVLVHASSVAAVPPTPIQFKIRSRDRLEYVLGGDRVPSPGLSAREVERALAGFAPVRLFQLRNGYMEFVFRAPAGE